MFEPNTEVIREGKASKPTEFGKTVKIQEAENRIITHYEVFSVPNHLARNPERRRHQKRRSFRRGQKWRTGAEGRISVLKRRHALNRCRYHRDAGMQRRVGLGVIADNLINIGRFLVATRSG